MTTQAVHFKSRKILEASPVPMHLGDVHDILRALIDEGAPGHAVVSIAPNRENMTFHIVVTWDVLS